MESLQTSRVLINVFSGSSNKDYHFCENVIMDNIDKLLIFRLKFYIYFFHNQFRITIEKA